MRNEAKAYFKNVIKSDFFIVDLINTVLGIGMIIMVVFSIASRGNIVSFAVTFILGSGIAILNLVKAIYRRSVFSILLFGLFTVFMLAMSLVLCLHL